MKRFVILFILILSVNICLPQDKFIKTFSLTGEDNGVSAIQTKDGGYLVYGLSMFALDSSCFLLKTSINGDSLWIKKFPSYPYINRIPNNEPIIEMSDSGFLFSTELYDTTLCFKTDKNGNILWSRKYYRLTSATFQPLTNGYILCGKDSTGNLVLIKTDDSLHEQWRTSFTESWGIYPWGEAYPNEISIIQTSDEGFIITGNSYHVVETNVSSICFLMKADKNGDSVWSKTIHDLPFEVFCNNQLTSENGFIVGGGLDSITNNGPTHANGFIMNFDGNGDTLWTKSYGGKGNQGFFSIEKTDDGGYIACGYNNPNASITPPFGNTGFYLTKINLEGTSLWTKYYPGVGGDISGLSASQTSDHGFIATGVVYDSLDNRRNVILIKTDSLGNFYPTGINEERSSGILNPFPNPTYCRVYLNPPGKYNSLEVRDLLGNTVLRKELNPEDNNTIIFDLTGNPKGIYILQLNNSYGSTTGKIVLK